MHKGNARNFDGVVLNVDGPDDSLEKLLDDLEYTSGVQILSRRDMGTGGMLVIEASRFAVSKIYELARKFKLSLSIFSIAG